MAHTIGGKSLGSKIEFESAKLIVVVEEIGWYTPYEVINQAAASADYDDLYCVRRTYSSSCSTSPSRRSTEAIPSLLLALVEGIPRCRPGYSSSLPNFTLEAALLLSLYNPLLTLCFPAPYPSCRSFECNHPFHLFLLRYFSVNTSATALRLHTDCAQTSNTKILSRLAANSRLAVHIRRDASFTHILRRLGTASSRSSIAAPSLTRSRPSITPHRLAVPTHQNSTTSQGHSSISRLSIPAANCHSHSDSATPIKNYDPFNTHNLLRLERGPSTWYGSWYCLRLCSRFPPPPLAHIHLLWSSRQQRRRLICYR